MAYMSQEKKAKLQPAIKAVLNKYGLKGSIAVRHSSTLVVNIKSGGLDFCSNYFETVNKSNFRNEALTEIPDHISPNEYYLENAFSGECLQALEALKSAMMQGNHNNSDSQSDYFDVGWYIDINIGSWDKPYQFSGKQSEPAIVESEPAIVKTEPEIIETLPESAPESAPESVADIMSKIAANLDELKTLYKQLECLQSSIVGHSLPCNVIPFPKH